MTALHCNCHCTNHLSITIDTSGGTRTILLILTALSLTPQITTPFLFNRYYNVEISDYFYLTAVRRIMINYFIQIYYSYSLRINLCSIFTHKDLHESALIRISFVRNYHQWVCNDFNNVFDWDVMFFTCYSMYTFLCKCVKLQAIVTFAESNRYSQQIPIYLHIMGFLSIINLFDMNNVHKIAIEITMLYKVFQYNLTGTVWTRRYSLN